MRSNARNLVKEIICVVLITGYCATTASITNSFFSFLESVITEMIHRRILDETLNKSINRWPRSENFIQALMEKIVKDPGFIVSIPAIVKHLEINVVK